MAPPPSGRVVGRTEGGGWDWDWKWLLFSFKCGAHRAHYWAVAVVPIAILVIGADVFLAAGSSSVEDPVSENSPLASGLVIVLLVLYVVVIWAQLAVAVKRSRDCDQSGACMFLALVPFGSLWILVECGFLPGTDGPNQCGGDPRGVSAVP